jgi:uncharacterized tellurite resistance protein B-like protein
MDESAARNLKNVMVLAMADGKVSEEERTYINALRNRLGVSDSDFHALCAEVRANPRKLSLPTDPGEALDAVRLLAELAGVDGEISAAERRTLDLLARRVGLSADELDRIALSDRTAEEAHANEIEALVQEIYEQFGSWDEATRDAKLSAIAAYGRAAVVPLLRVFESYRVPAGCETALEMKLLIARKLGRLGDHRAAYYLLQQISLGDMEDEVTCASLRQASALALGQCVGESFGADDEGIRAAREWWSGPVRRQYDQLAF